MRDLASEKLEKAFITLLLERRKTLGLSHQKLADKAGLHRSTIGVIESGKRHPTLLTCAKLCRALDISLVELIRKAEKRSLR